MESRGDIMNEIMREELKEYTKKKEYLICMDSDGCVMDTMEIKHMRCLGPCLVHIWELEEYRDELLHLWRDINLLSEHRGSNRFMALAIVLQNIHENYQRIEGLEEYVAWVEEAIELSPETLEPAYEASGNVCMKKALEWSEMVNQSMVMVADYKKVPFEGVKEALLAVHEDVDVVIVTAASRAEVEKEWKNAGIDQYTDFLMAQETGIKSECLKGLLEKGYAPNHILMIGDAPADLLAANEAGVLFYPVLATHETESWKEFPDAVKLFLDEKYEGEFEDEIICKFYKNLRML